MGLDTVEILMEIEERFNVSVPDDLAGGIETVGQMRDEVVRLLVAAGREESAELRQEVWDGIVAATAEVMVMDPALIRPESTWVGDITKYG